MTTVKLLVTEGKSNQNAEHNSAVARVFINKDYTYGYWVPESVLINTLSAQDKQNYYNQSEFDIIIEQANKIIEVGQTIYTKKFLTETA